MAAGSQPQCSWIESHLPVIGVPGAVGVVAQGEVLGEAQHRGIRVAVIVERIALGTPRERPVLGRQLLIARLVGPVVRFFALALQAVGGLIRLVVGVGIVVVAHKPRNHDSQPRNPSTFNLTPTRHQPIYHSAAQRLSSTRRSIQRRVTLLFEFGLPSPPWMS